jgi:hypothetical protein
MVDIGHVYRAAVAAEGVSQRIFADEMNHVRVPLS